MRTKTLSTFARAAVVAIGFGKQSLLIRESEFIDEINRYSLLAVVSRVSAPLFTARSDAACNKTTKSVEQYYY